jgi:prepilin-type N-terminal cleavage/methylation domain-containing protein
MTRRDGFTLFEIVVVLALIGLVVGGIIMGRSLIKDATLMSVMTDVNRFKSAVGTFYDRYQQLPGDFSQATNYWPACTDVAGNTCNGDGNGEIYDWADEEIRAWQHLTLSGLLDGTYTGVWQSAGDRFARGVNMPPCPLIERCFYRIGSIMPPSNEMFHTSLEHFISVTAIANNGSWPYGHAVTPQQAYILDRKFDDTNAITGAIQTVQGVIATGSTGAGHCSHNGSDPMSGATGSYTTSNYGRVTDVRCRVMFNFRKSELQKQMVVQ